MASRQQKKLNVQVQLLKSEIEKIKAEHKEHCRNLVSYHDTNLQFLNKEIEVRDREMTRLKEELKFVTEQKDLLQEKLERLQLSVRLHLETLQEV
jgi:hypothetical protein